MIITVTQREKDILSEEIGGKIEAVPTGTRIPLEVRPRRGRKNILFVGSMNRTQNIDAVLYFAREVFPAVRGSLKDIKLTVAGSGADDTTRNLLPADVEIAGFVKDIGVYYSSYAVSVVPLRAGAGMKSKIIESMAWGCPVVSTDVGAEGMGLMPDKDILIGDNAEEFADRLIKIYQDPDLWDNISKNAYALVKEKYDIRRMHSEILELI